MPCDNKKCQCELAPREPVYRLSLNYSDMEAFDGYAVVYVCTACAHQTDDQGQVFGACRRWREPKPCEHCGRPVLHDWQRPEPDIIACSLSCRRAVYLARGIIGNSKED
jgi:hypothetical protein